jgi:hypothetical protein
MRLARKRRPGLLLLPVLIALAGYCNLSSARETQTHEPVFKYAGGTESISRNCAGVLRLNDQEMVFHCPDATVSIPYSGIQVMQFRPNLSREVRKMKVKWRLHPQLGSSKNHLFAIVFKQDSRTHILVLDVAETDMVPYLAEIDLRAGQRVEVYQLPVEN